jgi:sugar transferase (PEP-CTERM/EpsH1 system associated)
VQHLLFLAHRLPYPPNKGDKVRSYHLLRHLAGSYRVHLGAFVDDPADFAHASVLEEICETCRLIELKPPLAKLKSLAALAAGEPLTLAYYRSKAMRCWVDDVLRRNDIGKVLVFSAAMAQYVMSASNVRRVADLVDVDSDKWRQYAAAQAWPYSAIYGRESRRLLDYERQIARTFDATVFVSAPEAALFRELAVEATTKVWHVSNGVDLDYFSPERSYANPYENSAQVVVFTGAMDYWPNADAVAWFAREVFPSVLARVPGAKFYIVGARPTHEVRKLAALPHVHVTGGVLDIRPYLAHATLAVAPLRTARGIQNKVLEAMAMAKPVLASPAAAEGIDASIGKDFLVAAGEEEFARETSRLLALGADATLGGAGRAWVLSACAWERNLSRFDDLLAPRGSTLHTPLAATKLGYPPSAISRIVS